MTMTIMTTTIEQPVPLAAEGAVQPPAEAAVVDRHAPPDDDDAGDAEQGSTAVAAAAAGDPSAPSFDFGRKRKKKKKKKQAPSSSAAPLAEPDAAGADAVAAEAPEPSTSSLAKEDGKEEEAEVEEPAEPDYTWDEMAARLYAKLGSTRSGRRASAKIAAPQVTRHGMVAEWTNFESTCRVMEREPEELRLWVDTQLLTARVSLSPKGSMIIRMRGRVTAESVLAILREYVSARLTCAACRSRDTIITKSRRIEYLVCNSCKAERSLRPIQAGFVAATRASRRAKRD